MKKYLPYSFIIIISIFIVTQRLFALNIDFVNKNIWLSKETGIVEDDNITIYSMIINNDTVEIGGDMVFLDIIANKQLTNPLKFSLPGKGTNQVIPTIWKATPGDHQFQAKVINTYEIVDGQKRMVDIDLTSSTSQKVFVDYDADADGLLGQEEVAKGTDPQNPDTDGDTLQDGNDPDPLHADADGDGDPDNIDPAPLDPNVKVVIDTDGDGVPDQDDAYPNDPSRTKKEVPQPVKETSSVNTVHTKNNEPESTSVPSENGDIQINSEVLSELDDFFNNTELVDDLTQERGLLPGLEAIDVAENSSETRNIVDDLDNNILDTPKKAHAIMIVGALLIVVVGIGFYASKSH